ncbi:MAG: hypothetical protein ABEJ22_00430 [Haloferacaceae archaeon]
MTLEEDRIFDERTGKMDVLVACGTGVVRVAASERRVGRFGMAHPCTARGVATAGGRVAVATDEDVLRDEFERTGFGPAAAVGFTAGGLVAGDGGGRVARLADDGGAWEEVGTVGAVRAIDGSLVAAGDGVYRVDDGDSDVGVDYAGLDDVRDVSGHGVPLAATGDGLYALGNGWMDELPGAFDAVSVGASGRAAAAGDGGVFVREAGGSEWTESDLPLDERVVALTHEQSTTVAVTDEGTLLLRGEGDEWWTQPLGLRDVAGVAVR